MKSERRASLKGVYLSALLCVTMLLMACGERGTQSGDGSLGGSAGGGEISGGPSNTLATGISATVSPSATPTPRPTDVLVPFTDPETGLRFLLPDSWLVGEPRPTALGRQRMVGPAPLGPGPASSTFLVTDAQVMPPAVAAEQLECGGGCPDAVALETITMNGRLAYRTIIGAETATPLEWYFIEHDGQLIFFTLHDPVTLETRHDLLQTVEFVVVTPTPTATRPPTATPTRTPIPTPLPPTETPTPSPEPTLPPTPVSITVDFLQALYDDPSGWSSLPYLSDRLRQTVPSGGAVYTLLALDRLYHSFQVSWAPDAGEGRVSMVVTLQFGDGSEEIRHVHLISDNGSWLVDDVTDESE